MNYKDKVKKAMELSLRDQVLQKYKSSYFYFSNSSTIEADIDDMVYLDVNYNILPLPHIKTLKQFEELYKALTGKELGDE